MTGIFSHINLLGNALSGSDQNHRVLSSNIANVNTPGYKTKRLDFNQLMQKLDSSESKNSAMGEIDVQLPDGLAERVDGNNVDIERELSEIKKNAMAYEIYSQLLASKLNSIQRAISRR